MPQRTRVDVFVGAGGVGKTTVAAAEALSHADAGSNTLVMTFDPSHRLKDTLGIGQGGGKIQGASSAEVVVEGSRGRLSASLLDAKETFDAVIKRHAPDDAARHRILTNRYYQQLAGGLSGVLEYMAVERLFEVVESREYDRIVLDTPPVSQALDFLEAPGRIVEFLDSGAVRLATRDWFDKDGNLRVAGAVGPLRRGLERYLDNLVGLDLLRDLVEFFTAFRPLFEGFRERASQVERLLRRSETRFSLVTLAAADRTQDTLFFARRLAEAGLNLERVVVNRLHADLIADDGEESALAVLARAVTKRERRALATVVELLGEEVGVDTLPMTAREPVDVDDLRRLARRRVRL